MSFFESRGGVDDRVGAGDAHVRDGPEPLDALERRRADLLPLATRAAAVAAPPRRPVDAVDDGRAGLQPGGCSGLDDSRTRARQRRAARRRTLERRTEQLETLQEQLREQADRDWLTGLHNRRYLAREIGRHAAAPGPGPFSLAVLDLDHFKPVNDRFGHHTGDEVLMRVAALLLGAIRGQDVVVRTGGEEFVLLMPHTDAKAAASACERLRTAIRDEPWDRIAPGIALTASIGVATAETAGDLQALTELADQRLYQAKGAGRDRVVA